MFGIELGTLDEIKKMMAADLVTVWSGNAIEYSKGLRFEIFLRFWVRSLADA